MFSREFATSLLSSAIAKLAISTFFRIKKKSAKTLNDNGPKIKP